MRLAARWLIGVAGLLAVLSGGAIAFKREISIVLVDRAIDQRVGRDITTGLPDGLHVILCGTGSPLPDPRRAGPCTAIIAGKHLFVIDAGDGAARTLLLAGIPIGRLERVFLTHFHSDHIDGLGALMLLRWTAGSATSPLPVAGPPGIDHVVSGFNAAYALDNGYRTAHHGPRIAPPTGAGGMAMPFAVPGAGALVFAEDGVRVTAFTVDHGPVKPAVGYRLDYKGRSVVVSGDTAFSPTLVHAAQGADLLVHEALQPQLVARMASTLAAHGQANTAQIMRDIPGYHTTPEQAADAARQAHVRQLVLTHIVPPLPMRLAYPAFLGDAARHFAGPITVGEDGVMFSLPAGTDAIDRRNLL